MKTIAELRTAGVAEELNMSGSWGRRADVPEASAYTIRERDSHIAYLQRLLRQRDTQIKALEAKLSRHPPLIARTHLHPAPPDLYCGPTLLITITGADYKSIIRPAINRARGLTENRGVRGMPNRHLITVLRELGCHVEELPGLNGKRRLHQWVADLSPNDEAIYAVVVGRHYVVVHRSIVVDSSRPNGEHVGDHPYHKSFVQQAWRVTPPEKSS